MKAHKGLSSAKIGKIAEQKTAGYFSQYGIIHTVRQQAYGTNDIFNLFDHIFVCTTPFKRVVFVRDGRIWLDRLLAIDKGDILFIQTKNKRAPIPSAELQFKHFPKNSLWVHWGYESPTVYWIPGSIQGDIDING